VDPDGTRCALAHLLDIGGQAELVQQIAGRNNNARVRELAASAELTTWLRASGLTLGDCYQALTALDPEWGISPCEEPGCGCALAIEPIGAPALTSLAVLTALFVYRRRGREKKRSGL